MSATPGLDPSQALATKVAELLAEPSYISEVSRKLRQVDQEYSEMNHENMVRLVSEAVQAMERSNDSIVVEKPSYDDFGGQGSGSPHGSLSSGSPPPNVEEIGDGKVGIKSWRRYVVAHNTDIDPSSIRKLYRPVVDTSVTMEEKLALADLVSSQGDVASEIAEDVTVDHIPSQFPITVSEGPSPRRIEYSKMSDYNSSVADFYIETQVKGYVIEVSTRWVNPVDRAYMSSKVDELAKWEERRNVPVDLIVIAPKFTGPMLERYGDGEFVHMKQVPFPVPGVGGNPVIISDPDETVEQFEGSPVVGDNYPVVDTDFGNFRDALDALLRDFRVMEELQYRRQISQSVFDVIGGD